VWVIVGPVSIEFYTHPLLMYELNFLLPTFHKPMPGIEAT